MIAGFGGISRDDKGAWKLGFYGKLREGKSLEAKIWGIYRGLTIIREHNWSDIHFKSDSQNAIDLFKEGVGVHHMLSNIINDGKHILNRTGSTVNYIYRGANECAVCLAHFEVQQAEELAVPSFDKGQP